MSVIVSKNSLILKMIRRSFWFLGEDCDTYVPDTTCGLFLAGVLSGLWHVFYTTFFVILALGFLYGSLHFIGIEFIGTDWLSLVSGWIQFPFLVGMLCSVATWFIVLPCYIISKIISFTLTKYNLYKHIDKLFDNLGSDVEKGLLKVGKLLSKLCKPVNYK